MKYALDDKPGLVPLLLYGLQWFVVSLPCVVIMGAVVSKMHYTGIAEQTLYNQKLFCIMGLATVVQVLWGHRLPLVIGPASVLLIGIMASLPAGIPAIYTAIALGGVLLGIAAWSGILHKIHGVFTPRVVAVILMLIAISLTPVILQLTYQSSGNPLVNLFFCLSLVLALTAGNALLQGVAKATLPLWGLILGSFVFYLLPGNSLPVPEAATPSVGTLSLFLPAWEFDTGTLLAFFFCFLALIINEIGSIESVSQYLQAGNIERRIKHGAGVLGITNGLCGATGVIGLVDFTLSSGVIAATRCASRYTLVPAGLALMACAFFPSAIRFLAAIPGPVMGALLLYLMGAQLATGLSMTVRERSITDFSSSLTVALPLLITLMIAYTPANTFAGSLPLLRPILGNSFVMGCLTVLLLEHVIFRKSSP